MGELLCADRPRLDLKMGLILRNFEDFVANKQKLIFHPSFCDEI